MSDFSQVREEFLGVLLEEKIGDLRVLQVSRPAGVGHGGEGRGWSMPLPPGTIWMCDSDLTAPTVGSSASQWPHACPDLGVGRDKWTEIEVQQKR